MSRPFPPCRWLYLELFQEVDAFRRRLGLVYTVFTAVYLASALNHH
jgi:hypothetical protein